MCLDEKHAIPRKYYNKTRVFQGYKVFSRRGSLLFFPFYGLKEGPGIYQSPIVPVNKWLRAEGERIPMARSFGYPSGFHLFENRGDALKYAVLRDEVVVPVEFRNVVAAGADMGLPVLVAKEIKVFTIQ